MFSTISLGTKTVTMQRIFSHPSPFEGDFHKLAFPVNVVAVNIESVAPMQKLAVATIVAVGKTTELVDDVVHTFLSRRGVDSRWCHPRCLPAMRLLYSMLISLISFFRFVMMMTSFVSLFDGCVCFCTSQTAHLSRSSPGVGFHPNLHPNQGFIRVRDIYCCCVNRFQNISELYRIAHYLQPSPTSSPVSRTEALKHNSFRAFSYVRCI